MDWLKAFYGVLLAIPELVKFARAIQDYMKANEIKGKVSDAVKASHDYMAANDKEHFNNVFSTNVK